MTESFSITRRTVLGAAAAGVGAALLPATAARAGNAEDADLIALRRDLYAHPETAGNEERTAGVVARRLRAAGLDVTTGVGGHGVVGVLTGHRRGRTVAYRADMDCIPAAGVIGGDGVTDLHACGHDLHTTIGVGVAEALARRRNRLAGRVVFVFQPAEEALAGATAMLADGVFDDTRPAEIHALHCTARPVGTFMVTPGFGMAGQDHGVVTFTGPDAAERAQRLAADVTALGTYPVLRSTADLGRMTADLETPNGPLSQFVYMQNVQASGAQVRIVYRCWPEERSVAVRAEIRRLAGDATVEFPAEPTHPAMVCPEREGRALRRFLGRAAIPAQGAIPHAGEDYAHFLRRMPGTYTFLGVRKPGAALETSFPHFAAFDPDERAIGHGVRAMTGWLAVRAAG